MASTPGFALLISIIHYANAMIWGIIWSSKIASGVDDWTVPLNLFTAIIWLIGGSCWVAVAVLRARR